MSEPKRSVEQARPGPSPLLVFGLALLAVVVGVGLWVGWLYWGSVRLAERAVGDEVAAVHDTWSRHPGDALIANPAPGEAYWIIRIPRLGDGWEWPVAVGVDDDVTGRAVGWYSGTAQPGQVGNFAVAGQCITGAQPFRHLRDLAVGDTVEVEGAAAKFTYEIISAPSGLTVQADDAWVLDPVPGQPDEAPVNAFITLTTCEDLYPTPDRSVGFGILTKTEEK